MVDVGPRPDDDDDLRLDAIGDRIRDRARARASPAMRPPRRRDISACNDPRCWCGNRCAPAFGTGRPPRCCPWRTRNPRARSSPLGRGCAASPPRRAPAPLPRSPRGNRSRGRSGLRSLGVFGTPARRIKRFAQPLRMMDVIETETSLDAETPMIRRAVATFDVVDLIVLDIEGQQAADAAIGAG